MYLFFRMINYYFLDQGRNKDKNEYHKNDKEYDDKKKYKEDRERKGDIEGGSYRRVNRDNE